MLKGDVRPSTLEGVKRLATQIGKERGIKHAIALDLAARAANCANYTHARRTLPTRGTRHEQHYVLLTIYWYDSKTHDIGRETYRMELPKPILEICSKADLKRVSGFGWLRMVAPDHFVSDSLAQSQLSARSIIGRAERSLRFMQHTGLRPSRDSKGAYPDRTQDTKLPGTDHATDWYDPASGQFILVDEPYSKVPDDPERMAWAKQHGWHLRMSTWPGMYNPYRCGLYVATDGRAQFDFDALMAKIDAIPAPAVGDDWVCESVPSHEVFVSPAARSEQDRRRARSKGTVMPMATDTTIPYNGMLGGARRRPSGAMGVPGHIEMGRILKAVLHSKHRPWGAYQRIDSVRSTLEDWMAREIGNKELAGPEFFDVYYHDADSEGPYAEAAQSRGGLVRILRELKSMLRGAYPDCAPLRQQLHKIDMAVSLIERMKDGTD